MSEEKPITKKEKKKASVLRDYCFPDHKVSIKAESLEAAIEKLNS